MAQPISLSTADMDRLSWALSDVSAYLTDNSCGDPECCGGPYFSHEDYLRGLEVMQEFNLYDQTLSNRESEK